MIYEDNRQYVTRATVVIITLIGLLHGFGFSFLLSDLPGPDSPYLVASLLSFNIGIEFSQLLIVSVVFILLSTLARANA